MLLKLPFSIYLFLTAVAYKNLKNKLPQMLPNIQLPAAPPQEIPSCQGIESLQSRYSSLGFQTRIWFFTLTLLLTQVEALKFGLKTDVCSPRHPLSCWEMAVAPRQDIRPGAALLWMRTASLCIRNDRAWSPRQRALQATVCAPLALMKPFPSWPPPRCLEGSWTRGCRQSGSKTGDASMGPTSEALLGSLLPAGHFCCRLCLACLPGCGQDEPPATSLHVSLSKTCAGAHQSENRKIPHFGMYGSFFFWSFQWKKPRSLWNQCPYGSALTVWQFHSFTVPSQVPQEWVPPRMAPRRGCLWYQECPPSLSSLSCESEIKVPNLSSPSLDPATFSE